MLNDEAKDILEGASKPDSEAPVLKEITVSNDTEKKKRGRPKKSGSPVVKKTQGEVADYSEDARAVNTIIFTLTASFCGTSEAWPEDDKAKIMDNALARYMSFKGIETRPEFALLAAYAGYAHSIIHKPAVKENLAKRFGGILGKFGWVRKITDKFKKKGN